MPGVSLRLLHVLQAVLADPQSRLLPVVLRIGAEVPRVNSIVSDDHLLDIFDLGALFMLLFEFLLVRVFKEGTFLMLGGQHVLRTVGSSLTPRPDQQGRLFLGGGLDSCLVTLFGLLFRQVTLGGPSVIPFVQVIIVHEELLPTVARLQNDGLEDLVACRKAANYFLAHLKSNGR